MPPPVPLANLLSRIPLSARTIILVGCGGGQLAEAYRRMNPRARLLGIEPDPLAADQAAAHLDEVAGVSLSAGRLPFRLPEGADCIIYNDVLQHLDDPAALLRRHAAILSPGGVMLIRVPNAEHWRLIQQRLQGDTDDGLPGWDQHCHSGWMSQSGLPRLLRRAGLASCDIVPGDAAAADPDAADRFFQAMQPALSALGIDPAAYVRRASASHLIARVRRDPIRPMTLTGNMLPPVGGVSHVRVVHPLQALATDPAIATAVTNRVSTAAPGDEAPRIFILHRPSLMGESGLETLRTLARAGYLIVTEFDDHPEHFPMMRLGGDLSFLGVHALQTSTPAMAEALRRYNPELAIFPNAVVSLPEVRNFTDPDRITMFFGALNREQDWQPLMPVINAVAAQAGDRLCFQVIHDRTFFDALQTPHKSFTATCDYDTYVRILGSAEVSFMPLADNPFNRAKSDLKFIEAGACRVASLASSVVYGDSVQHGCTGLLFRDPVEFQTMLLRLVATPRLARDVADAARRYVMRHRMLAYQVAPRIAWYRALWNRRAVLEEARQARLRQRLQQAHAGIPV